MSDDSARPDLPSIPAPAEAPRDSGRAGHAAAGPEAVTIAILTISDTRGPDDDPSGDWLAAAAAEAGHEVVARRWTRDDADAIRAAYLELLAGDAVVVLSTGGTGIAGRDATVPVAESLIVKPIPGFGELFRMLSWREVGAAAMLSRATGGVAGGEAGRGMLFALPGSRNAVRTAWEGLLRPELPHLAFELARHVDPG